MPVSKKNKAAIMRGMLVTKQKSYGLEMDLKFAGKFAEADTQAVASAALSTAIDKLLGQAMDAWAGTGKTQIKQIKSANSDLQTSIREIRKDVRTAQNIVKAVGLVDDVTEIAAKLSAGAG